ncbi:MAG: hypothetical protein HS108_03495 [Planctomycetes bacterium]|jgi:cell division protein FtsB|nr:hypothetical protein [Planctomycetota bacterium]MCL4731976.1 hypothetical protein [Planctomycetota bacterium]
MSGRKSIRESLRMEGRDWSLLAAAGALVVFGLAVHNSIVPGYHEHQAILRRHAELKQQLQQAKDEGARLQDEIDAMDDPYYLAQRMMDEYGWHYAPPPQAEAPKPGKK